MNSFDVSSKLNLRTTDYLAGVGLTQDFLASLGAKGIVAFDTKFDRSKSPGYRPFEKADESAFDKVVFRIDDMLILRQAISYVLDNIYRVSENGGYALLLGVEGDLDNLLHEIARRNQATSDLWFFETEQKGKYDVYFKVRKDAIQ